MAYVDETVVAAHLNKAARNTGMSFKAVPSDCESEDAEVKVLRDGKVLTELSFQVGGGYVVLNQYGYNRPGDPNSLWSRQIATWGVQEADLDMMFPAAERFLRDQASR